MKLKILTYNTLFAGRDGPDQRRANAQLELLADIRPDVFLMQEARGLEANGGRDFYALERTLGMRGFLAAAPATGQNVAIFIREPLQPIAFEADRAHFHHAFGSLQVAVPGVDAVLGFMTAHLCPAGAHVRRREAAYLGILADARKLSLLAGDFNSASPHDPAPADWEALPAHHRARYAAEDTRGIDHSVLAHLESAGWVDLGDRLDPFRAPTVPTPAYRDAEFATMRCDYVLATPSLARFATGYEVIRNKHSEMASDHYPVSVTFDLAS